MQRRLFDWTRATRHKLGPWQFEPGGVEIAATQGIEHLQKRTRHLKLTLIKDDAIDLPKGRIEHRKGVLHGRYRTGLGLDNQGNQVGMSQCQESIFLTQQRRSVKQSNLASLYRCGRIETHLMAALAQHGGQVFDDKTDAFTRSPGCQCQGQPFTFNIGLRQ